MPKKGLTIIEVIISILLFSVVLLGAMALYFYSDSSFRFAEHKKMALELADARMEDLKSWDYDDLTTGTWPSESVDIGELTGTLNITVSTVPPDHDYKLISMNVIWTDPSRTVPQNIALQTYIAPEPE